MSDELDNIADSDDLIAGDDSTEAAPEAEVLVRASVPLDPVLEAGSRPSVNGNADLSNLKPEWYILHTYSGYENLVKENLVSVFEKNQIQDRLYSIVIPQEDVVEEKNGKRRVVRHRMFPSYVLIKMKYTRDMWHLITGTRGVTGFVGPQGKPTPLTLDEVRRMKLENVVVKSDVSVGDHVKVMQGPLSDMVGEVTSVNAQTGKCRVEVNMFGRLTPADLDISQVEKVI